MKKIVFLFCVLGALIPCFFPRDEIPQGLVLIFYAIKIEPGKALPLRVMTDLDKYGFFPAVKRAVKSGTDLPSKCSDLIGEIFETGQIELMGTFNRPIAARAKQARFFLTLGGFGWSFAYQPEGSSDKELALKIEASCYSDIPASVGETGVPQYQEIIDAFVKLNPPKSSFQETVSLKPEEPILLHASNDGSLLVCCLAWVDSPLPDSVPSRSMMLRSPDEKAPALPPPTVERHVARFPAEFRNIQGEVVLRVGVDPKGNVTSCKVVGTLHPYLDFCARQAVYRWKFAPPMDKGRNAPAEFDLAYSFNKLVLPNDTAASKIDEPSSDLTGGLPKAFSNYARKLVDTCPFFMCEELIDEKHIYLARSAKPTLLKVKSEYDIQQIGGQKSRQDVYTTYRVNFSERSERNRYSNEYQILGRDASMIELRKNIGRGETKDRGRQSLADDSRFSNLNPFRILALVMENEPRRLLGAQPFGTERIRGAKLEIYRIVPIRADHGDFDEALLWVEAKTGALFRMKISGVPIRGYEDVLRESVELDLDPKFEVRYEFGFENNGLRYPTQVNVDARYAVRHLNISIDKISAEITYKKFRFFSVETELRIK